MNSINHVETLAYDKELHSASSSPANSYFLIRWTVPRLRVALAPIQQVSSPLHSAPLSPGCPFNTPRYQSVEWNYLECTQLLLSVVIYCPFIGCSNKTNRDRLIAIITRMMSWLLFNIKNYWTKMSIIDELESSTKTLSLKKQNPIKHLVLRFCNCSIL